MQFHLNGFHPGDPRIHNPQARVVAPPIKRPLPSHCDVMIVGCGPAGLNLAAQLSQFRDIHTVITDLKDDRLTVGQADGMACRTLEMFQAYGFAEQVIQEAYGVNEVAFWKPDPRNLSHIARSSKIDDVEEDLSEMPHVIINQARIHDHFLNVMKHSAAVTEPYYSRKLIDLKVDHANEEYPVTLTFERAVTHSQFNREVETVRCKYAVGCDGARSQVRKSIGHELVGDALNQAWGVMDVLAVTDFPDIRLKAAIQSTNEGNILIIPREGGYMVRIYIELDKLKEDQRVDRENMTVDVLIGAANRIMAPYTLDVKEVPWWSVYEIGQRLTTAFDDSRDGQNPHVFLAGDACHTHSPKAGQGLNTSVMDTWNLGWKMAHVLTGRAPKELLSTYSAERADIAKQLIDFDREWSKMFSSKPRTEDNPGGVDPAEFQKYFQLFARFTAGVGIEYKPSIVVGDSIHQHLATGQPVGQRFHSAPVIRHGDAKPVQLGHCHTANGAWRVYAFAGSDDPASDSCRLRKLAHYLGSDPASPIKKHTPPGADTDSVIDFRAVYQTPHRELDRTDLHPFMTPVKGALGLRDYEKVFCVDHSPKKNIYDMRGISKSEGCILVVRPDQYVAAVLPLNQHQELTNFFGRCLSSKIREAKAGTGSTDAIADDEVPSRN